jgi:RNA polymerase sigma-70 factor (ECF subfamily)
MDPVTSSHGLVERVKQGDGEGFSRLLEKYHSRLAVLIHYRLGRDMLSLVDVDDILQETLLRAFRDIGQFQYRSPGSFMNWLARIADHVIADLARSQARHKRAGDLVRFRSPSNPCGPEPADFMTPSRIFAENETLARLIEMLTLLPDNYRTVLLMAKIEGLSTAEIAQRLVKSNQAIALLLHRAVQRFRVLHDESKNDHQPGKTG